MHDFGPAFPGPVLGIESSCDETAVAVVSQRRVLAARMSSQVPIHRRFGGVVPEVASRNHLLSMLPVIEDTLADAGLAGTDLAGIAVTNRPGLIGALLVGVQTAKTLAAVWGIPALGVHHIRAHCWAATLRTHDDPENTPPIDLPALALAVSGGHTSLFIMRGPDDFEEIGRTLDDAAGEALDKFGKLLGLPYPAGPEIDRIANNGDAKRFDLPRGMRGRDDLAFSFSGLKTAGRLQIERLQAAHGEVDDRALADLCASYQDAAVAQLVKLTVRAAEQTGLGNIVVAGGVAANSLLRHELGRACEERRWTFTPVPRRWCTDNGAMIAGLGADLLAMGHRNDTFSLDATPTQKRQPQRPAHRKVAARSHGGQR